MFGRFNKQINQCVVTHRKHVKRRLFIALEIKRHFSNSKYSKLGDLYARLGLSGDVSQDDIKNAYYKLSKEHHPDKNKGCSVSAEKFRSITEAYEILGNVSSRAQYDRETPYGRINRRPRRTYPQQQQQPDTTFYQKDDELSEKIREFRKNMRKKPKNTNSDDEDYVYRRENVFDFDAWYKAHFENQFETKLRSERINQYEQQYREKVERIMRGGGVRPPRRYLQRKDPSDIEIQTEEMLQRKLRKDLALLFRLAIILIVGFVSIGIIIERYNSIDVSYVNRQRKEENTKE